MATNADDALHVVPRDRCMWEDFSGDGGNDMVLGTSSFAKKLPPIGPRYDLPRGSLSLLSDRSHQYLFQDWLNASSTFRSGLQLPWTLLGQFCLVEVLV